MTWLEDPLPGSALPSPAYCFASVIVWTENKNELCFEEQSASGWPSWRIFWPQNDLTPLLYWRYHCSCSSAYSLNFHAGSVLVFCTSAIQYEFTRMCNDIFVEWKEKQQSGDKQTVKQTCTKSGMQLRLRMTTRLWISLARMWSAPTVPSTNSSIRTPSTYVLCDRPSEPSWHTHMNTWVKKNQEFWNLNQTFYLNPIY